jgi:hypothetical protein
MNVIKAVNELRPVASFRAMWEATDVLWRGNGFLRTAWKQRCIDGDGQAVPWFTYPAIEYLKQLDFSAKDIFEYGSGHSTVFWGSRARSVVAVEHNPDWHEFVQTRVGPNCRLVLETDLDRYVRTIAEVGSGEHGWDVIVIDGLVERRTRAKGAVLALGQLRPGGMVIVDNSDYLPGTCRILREAGGLIQVDLSGLGPCNGYAWTTSVFLTKDFRIGSLRGRQPQHPAGGRGLNWEPGLEQKLESGAIDPVRVVETARHDVSRALLEIDV